MMLKFKFAIFHAPGQKRVHPAFLDHAEIVAAEPCLDRHDIYSEPMTLVSVIGTSQNGAAIRRTFGPVMESATDVHRMKTLAEGIPVPGWCLDAEGQLVPERDVPIAEFASTRSREL